MEIGELNIPQIQIPLENNSKLYHSNAIINGTVEDKDLKDTVTIHYSIDNLEYTLPPINTEGKITKFTLDLTKLSLLPVTPHILKVWAVDNTNTKSKIEERNFIITYLKDPKIILTEKNWTKNDITFKIVDTENNKQDVIKYQYRINNKEWIDCKTDTNIIIKENGINKIDVKVVGVKKGDFSNIITDYAKIDKISPKNTTPTASKTINSITVNCSQTDNESGIDNTKKLYAIKKGNKWSKWQTNNTFEGLKPNTKYVIKTKSTDNAGNTSESKELKVITEQVKVETPKKDNINNNNKNEEIYTKDQLNSSNNKQETNKDSKIEKVLEDINITGTTEDNTVANTKIPKTGENSNLILLAIAILAVIAIKSYNKLKNI